MNNTSVTAKAMQIAGAVGVHFPLTLLPSYYPELQFPDTTITSLGWRFFKTFSKMGISIGICTALPALLAFACKIPEPSVKKYTPVFSAIAAQIFYVYFIQEFDRNSGFWFGLYLAGWEVSGTLASELTGLSAKKDIGEIIEDSMLLFAKSAGNIAVGLLTSNIMAHEVVERAEILAMCFIYRQLEALIDARKYLSENDGKDATLVPDNMHVPLKYMSSIFGCGMLAYALSKK